MDFKVGIIGLGYVGLPIAVASARTYPTLGFDINTSRITDLRQGIDRTREVNAQELSLLSNLSFSSDPDDLKHVNFFIITVPTPVDDNNNPDLFPLKSATRTIAPFLKPEDIIVYESTVFPGCTEEVCVPILEEESGLKYNVDFYCGYSPERINPGDKAHTFENILKVVSGSTPETLDRVDEFYSSIVTAGTYRAPSLKVAEAAKVIENSQRDINIAFVNELALIFDRIGIDTQEVLKAAGTKWNFLKFYPGLVGGHCIGVDPFYLTHKSQELGYHPEVILAGRRINDQMGSYIAQKVVKLMASKKAFSTESKVLILGVTFKENCPDVRNSKVVDIRSELISYNLKVDVFDPSADKFAVIHEYGFDLIESPDFSKYQAVILAVSHDVFKDLDWSKIRKNVSIIFDVKGFLPVSLVDSRL